MSKIEIGASAERIQWPDNADRQREINAQYDELKRLIHSRDCIVCESTPRIANIQEKHGGWYLRCNCFPNGPKLKHIGGWTQKKINRRTAEILQQNEAIRNTNPFNNTEESTVTIKTATYIRPNGEPFDVLIDADTGEIIGESAVPSQPTQTITMPAVSNEPPMPLTPAQIKQTTDALKAAVAEMTEGVHYGIIPGTNNKQSLWEPGAELLRLTFRLSWDYTFIDERENIETGECYYRVQAFIPGPNGEVGAKWEASADSREKRFGRMDAAVRPNLVRDTAIKRAFVNLMRNATGASGEFSEAYDSAGELNDYDANQSPAKQNNGATPLVACPLHKTNWQTDNYRNRFHPTESGRCMFKAVMAQYFDREQDVRDWTSATLNDWLKTNFGTTRSRLTDEDSIEAINRLKESRPEKTDTAPVIRYDVTMVTTTSETPSDATDGPESNETPVDGGNTPENEEPTPDTQANQPSWSDDQFADIERARGQRGITEQTAYENAGAMSPTEWNIANPDGTPEDYLRAISTE